MSEWEVLKEYVIEEKIELKLSPSQCKSLLKLIESKMMQEKNEQAVNKENAKAKKR